MNSQFARSPCLHSAQFALLAPKAAVGVVFLVSAFLEEGVLVERFRLMLLAGFDLLWGAGADPTLCHPAQGKECMWTISGLDRDDKEADRKVEMESGSVLQMC